MSNTVKVSFCANNLKATQHLAAELAQLVTQGMILLLNGDLGSGKTTFMQAFGRSLGIDTTITSPTFTLIDEYNEGRLPLYHIDLYRLEPSQTSGLHLEEYWRGVDFPVGIVAIEWASRLLKKPNEYLEINLSTPKSNAQSRNIELTAIGSAYILALQQLQAKIPRITHQYSQ